MSCVVWPSSCWSLTKQPLDAHTHWLKTMQRAARLNQTLTYRNPVWFVPRLKWQQDTRCCPAGWCNGGRTALEGSHWRPWSRCRPMEIQKSEVELETCREKKWVPVHLHYILSRCGTGNIRLAANVTYAVPINHSAGATHGFVGLVFMFNAVTH